ncbi:hypothetical protein [Rhodococcus marinonascens]|uniref:hypothetical protein n=1 Tax=Rhodococcus marinonascens TaxID=38311 RepID=UPI0014756B60|nr:hypothetical protein [Rhodococcus marinonascens]
MSNDRLWDDSIFAPSNSPRPEPQFVSSLVTQLGLARASHAEREQGITKWLDRHTPSERLKESLISSGYRHLLHLPA